jgi:hypothetical protein
MKHSGAWLLVAGVLLAGCGESRGYVVLVEVVGPPEAFSGRTLEVEGVTAPPAVARTGSTGLWTTEVALCTENRAAFLNPPLRVRVLEQDRVLVDRQVERVACRKSATPAGELERNTLYLETTGALIADFGNDSRTFAACDPPNRAMHCAQKHF